MVQPVRFTKLIDNYNLSALWQRKGEGTIRIIVTAYETASPLRASDNEFVSAFGAVTYDLIFPETCLEGFYNLIPVFIEFREYLLQHLPRLFKDRSLFDFTFCNLIHILFK